MTSSTSPSIRPIGDRPLSLATHLRVAVNLLLDTTTPSSYSWGMVSSCNCGMLARAITGDTHGTEVGRSFNTLINRRCGLPDDTSTFVRCFAQKPITPVGHHTWSNIAAEFCPHNPRESAPEVIGRLLDAGLDVADFPHLEYLNHPELRDPNWTLSAPPDAVEPLATLEGVHYASVANAAYYMARWAEAIEAHHATHPAPEAAATAPTEATLEAIETRALVGSGVGVS